MGHASTRCWRSLKCMLKRPRGVHDPSVGLIGKGMDPEPCSVWVWPCFKVLATSMLSLRGAAKELNLQVEIVECRRADHVDESLDALVLPGGESTTMRIASRYESLLGALFEWMDAHPERPVLGPVRAPFAGRPEGRPYSLRAFLAMRGASTRILRGRGDVSLDVPKATIRNRPAGADRFAHQP